MGRDLRIIICSNSFMGLEKAGRSRMSTFQGRPLSEVPLPHGRSGFCALRPSTNWARCTQITESNLLFSKPTGFNVKLV